MAGTPLVIGIDAGGTTTRIAASRGRRQFTLTAGTGNLLTLGEAGFAKHLRDCARTLARRTRVQPRRVASVCLGGAGLGRAAQRGAAEACLRRLWPRARVNVTDDATIFLRAVFDRRPGVVLMAGTGSICLGRRRDGTCERAGGWGALLGDAGSGFALARRAVMHALEVRDGLRAPTPFAAAVLKRLGVKDALELVTRIADAAPVVLDRARRGDAVARAIVREESAALARLAPAVLERLRDDVGAVALGGGLLRKRYYAAAVRDALARTCPGVRAYVARKEPVLGALAMAHEAITTG
jgi:N-acetylglucosamine kinase-like BadF-type ATPase